MPLFISILFILQFGRFAIAKKYFEVKGEMNNRNDFEKKKAVCNHKIKTIVWAGRQLEELVDN